MAGRQFGRVSSADCPFDASSVPRSFPATGGAVQKLARHGLSVTITDMYSRWFSIAVIMFWTVTMGWLFQRKILPPLVVGDPPSYRTILADREQAEKPAGWMIYLDNQPLGWATSRPRLLDNGVTEFRSRVHLKRLPLEEITPGWMKSLLQIVDSRELGQLAMNVDIDGAMEIDPLGRPIGFNSKALFGEDTAQRDEQGFLLPGEIDGRYAISIQGTVEGPQLKLKVRSGEFVYNTSTYLSPDALMTDALSPQARLPELKVGQSWTVPVYSPLRPPTSPVEILHARVERRDPTVWQDQVVPAYLVVFNSDPGGEMTNHREARAKAWVDLDGNVLKQEVLLLSSHLLFERLPDNHPLLRNP